MIWMAAPDVPVRIRATLSNQGLGWFTLAARTAAGEQTDLKRTDQADADGDALFRVTPSSDLLFKLRVLGGYVSDEGSDVWLQVSQNGVVLECQDSSGKVINSNGGNAFEPVKLGPVAQAKTSSFHFEVWP